MSNSPLVNYTQISPNRYSPRNHKIDRIPANTDVLNTDTQLISLSNADVLIIAAAV